MNQRVKQPPIPGRSNAARSIDPSVPWDILCEVKGDIKRLHGISQQTREQNKTMIALMQEQLKVLKQTRDKMDKLHGKMSDTSDQISDNSEHITEAVENMEIGAEIVMEAAIRASYQGVIPGDAEQHAKERIEAIRQRKTEERERAKCQTNSELKVV